MSMTNRHIALITRCDIINVCVKVSPVNFLMLYYSLKNTQAIIKIIMHCKFRPWNSIELFT